MHFQENIVDHCRQHLVTARLLLLNTGTRMRNKQTCLFNKYINKYIKEKCGIFLNTDAASVLFRCDLTMMICTLIHYIE